MKKRMIVLTLVILAMFLVQPASADEASEVQINGFGIWQFESGSKGFEASLEPEKLEITLKAILDNPSHRVRVTVDPFRTDTQILNAEYHLIGDGVTLKLGKMKVPFGYELYLTGSDRLLTTSRNRASKQIASREIGAIVATSADDLQIHFGLFTGLDPLGGNLKVGQAQGYIWLNYPISSTVQIGASQRFASSSATGIHLVYEDGITLASEVVAVEGRLQHYQLVRTPIFDETALVFRHEGGHKGSDAWTVGLDQKIGEGHSFKLDCVMTSRAPEWVGQFIFRF